MKFYLEPIQPLADGGTVHWEILSLDDMRSIRITGQHLVMTYQATDKALDRLGAHIVDDAGEVYTADEFITKWRQTHA